MMLLTACRYMIDMIMRVTRYLTHEHEDFPYEFDLFRS
jgi:hypothetical protein